MAKASMFATFPVLSFFTKQDGVLVDVDLSKDTKCNS